MKTSTVGSTIEKARTAASKISQLTARRALTSKSGAVVWGQFLDDERDDAQTGIFGTSAAVVLLETAGAPENAGELRLRAGLAAESDIRKSALFNDPEDPDIVYKLAAFAECTPPVNSGAPLAGAAALLARQMTPGGGWSHYIAVEVPAPTAQMLPTAVVLYALRNHGAFRQSPQCREALLWLTRALKTDTEVPPATSAMATLALLHYPSEGIGVPDFGMVVETSRGRLARWASRRPSSQIGEHYAFHYSVRTSTRTFNQYLFLLPDCIVAMVLLNGTGLKRGARPYIRRVARVLTANVRAADGFRSPTSLRKGTVDQLWVFRVLQAVGSLNVNQLRGLDYYVPTRVNRRQALTYSALTLATLGFGALSISEAPLAYRGIGFLISAVTAGVLASSASHAVPADE